MIKSDLDKTVKAFKDKLLSVLEDGDIEDQKIVNDLVVYFENVCKNLRQDNNSGFFNGNGNDVGATNDEEEPRIEDILMDTYRFRTMQ